MHITGIISRKRDNLRLTADEIRAAVLGYSAGDITDYQMSALLMACFIRGLDDNETLALTRAMIESGEIADLSGIAGVKVDKHSTGGVGDGTSIVIAPLVAACGVVVPMMCGRGLGHTGGTLDKLESIPGFRTHLQVDEYKRQLEKTGVAIIGQTDAVAPADKKMYALRDVTATVECIGLIAASIMSKKLAEGCDALVLDVKSGSGAFMKSDALARQLARVMTNIGAGFGVTVEALITDMNQPLGMAVGNSLEVAQAIETLKGGGPADFRSLVFTLASRMLMLGIKGCDERSALDMLADKIKDGSALKKFTEIIVAQGGDSSVIDVPERILPKALNRRDICAKTGGFVGRIDTAAVGRASVMLGAGRLRKEDVIDYGAGIMIHRKHGDCVTAGEPLATMYYNRPPMLEDAAAVLEGAWRISRKRPPPLRLIKTLIPLTLPSPSRGEDTKAPGLLSSPRRGED